MRPLDSPRRSLLVAIMLLALLGLVSAGCGDDDGGSESGDGRDGGSTTATTTTDDDEGGGAIQQCSTQSLIHLVRGEQLGAAHRITEYESSDCGSTEVMLEAAMRALLTGPSADDRAAGLTTTIPTGTTLNDLNVDEDLVTIDLSKKFESGGGSLSMTLRVAQVVATLTAISGVERVAFVLDGTAVEAIGGEGVAVDPPRTREDIEGELPAILVEDPAPGDCIGDAYAADEAGQLHVGGSANVFEAALVVELRQGTDTVERERVTATSGTGTRGTFETVLPTTKLRAGTPATLVAYSQSAKDGSRINVVEIELDPSC